MLVKLSALMAIYLVVLAFPAGARHSRPETAGSMEARMMIKSRNTSSTAFPRNFLWGAATSSHQVEGNNRWNDWWSYEQSRQAALQVSGMLRPLPAL